MRAHTSTQAVRCTRQTHFVEMGSPGANSDGKRRCSCRFQGGGRLAYFLSSAAETAEPPSATTTLCLLSPVMSCMHACSTHVQRVGWCVPRCCWGTARCAAASRCSSGAWLYLPGLLVRNATGGVPGFGLDDLARKINTPAQAQSGTSTSVAVVAEAIGRLAERPAQPPSCLCLACSSPASGTLCCCAA